MTRDPASLLQRSQAPRNRGRLGRRAVASRAIGAALGPALVAALPAYAGLGLIAGILMGPSGMFPPDMDAAAASSPLVRALLWAAWIAAVAPAARRLLLAGETAYLRWLPIGRALFWTAHALGLLVLELPWALLWYLAAGPVGGLAAALAAAGIHAALAVRRRGRGWAGACAVIAGLAAILWARPSPDAAVGAAGLAGLAAAVVLSFARAAEAPASLWRPRPAGGPVVALIVCLAGRLIDAALAGRMVVAATVGGGLAGLFVRANDLGREALVVAAAAAGAVGTVGVAARIGPALIADIRALDWVLAAAGTSRETRAGALIGAAALGGAVAGAAAGAVVAAIAGGPVAIAAAAASASAIAVVAVVAAPRRVAANPARVWALSMAAAAGLSVAVATVGPVALAVVPAVGLAGFGVLTA